jgi:DNA-binding CsgD family transcriptional regulator
VLYSRGHESTVIDRLLAHARSAQGEPLVLRGAAGIGKTALLDLACERAGDFRVLRATGAEFEMELPYAGLHALCAPLLTHLEWLPQPQRDAVETAFGLRGGASPDPFRIGTAVLSLVSEAAEADPVICVVDDAQWLDRASAQALAFAARRMGSERVAILFGVREPHAPAELAALPTLHVAALPDTGARALLMSLLHTSLDEQVVNRIIAEARGNPLALREFAVAARAGRLAGGFSVGPVGHSIDAMFRSRIEALPPDTRRLLLLAAAEPIGDSALLWRAAERLGLDPVAAEPAEAAGLLEMGSRIQFAHPLVRSAVYQPAPPQQRRSVHEALAAATDPGSDPDRHAWHRAQAAPGPDEDVSAELVRCADRARERGGMSAAAAFLERAAALTSESSRRAQYIVGAAEAGLHAGSPEEAQRLLDAADVHHMPDLLRARTDALHGMIAWCSRRSGDAPALLRAAAQRLAPLDAAASREAHLDALLAGLAAGSFGTDVEDVTSAVSAAPATTGAPTSAGLLLEALGRLVAGQADRAAPSLLRCLAESDGTVWAERPALVCLVALEVWDLDHFERILSDQVAHLRRSGALVMLPQALSPLAGAILLKGRAEEAATMLAESDALAEALGVAPVPYTNLLMAAIRGNLDHAAELITASIRDAAERGEQMLVVYAHFASAMLFNGSCDFSSALAAARQAATPLPLSLNGMRLRELVEAAVRAGQRDEALEALAELRENTQASSTLWARGIEAVCTALTAEGEAADAAYRQSLELLEAGGILYHLARAELLYGEWLRRENRPSQARLHLRQAFDRFRAMGAEAFARRTQRELRAAGDPVGSVDRRSAGTLTPHELHIARLVGEGCTTKEVAAELFLSPRTVDAHLRNIFRKLDIRSRRQLRTLTLPEAA